MRQPHIAIMRAAARGVGIHLSPDEVVYLAREDGIGLVANNEAFRTGRLKEALPPFSDGWLKVSARQEG